MTRMMGSNIMLSRVFLVMTSASKSWSAKPSDDKISLQLRRLRVSSRRMRRSVELQQKSALGARSRRVSAFLRYRERVLPKAQFGCLFMAKGCTVCILHPCIRQIMVKLLQKCLQQTGVSGAMHDVLQWDMDAITKYLTGLLCEWSEGSANLRTSIPGIASPSRLDLLALLLLR